MPESVMELHTHGLSVRFTFQPPDQEAWMWCTVQLDVPGFRGEFDFQLERANLEHFRTQLAHTVEPSHWPCQARLTSTDEGVDLLLQVARSGQITGEYRFCNHAGGATLTGMCQLDQTYLGPLLSQINQVLAEFPGTSSGR